MKRGILFISFYLVLSFCMATTITVTSTDDSGTGSLRQALADANDGDTIDFAVTGTILLASPLDITKNITILGPGAKLLAIDGNNATVIFREYDLGMDTVTVSGLEIRNASGDRDGGAFACWYTCLNIKNCNIHSNTLSVIYGAAINIYGEESILNISNTALHHNTCAMRAPCISVSYIKSVTISSSTIYGNSGTELGQAIFITTPTNMDVTLTDVTIGGHNTGTSVIEILSYGSSIVTFNIKNCVLDNGIKNFSIAPDATLLFNSLGHNLSSDNSMSNYLTEDGDMNNTSALLDPAGIADNGGTTPTVALQCNSPAINAGASDIAFDQRGYARIGVPDIGAYESSIFPTSSSLSVNSCGSYVSPSGKYTWATSNIYHDTIPNTVGCDSIITIYLTVNPSYETSVSDTICYGENYTFPDGHTETGIEANMQYTSMLQTKSGCDSVVTTKLTVDKVDVSVSQSGSTLTANAAEHMYQWLDCNNDNMPLPGETAQSFTPEQSGSYSVLVDNGKCSGVSGCFDISHTGIPVLPPNEIKIYPNPSTGNFSIEGKDIESVIITTIDGKIVGKTIVSKTKNAIELNIWQKGVFLIIAGSAKSTKTEILLVK